MAKPLFRYLTLDRAKVDAKERTIQIAFSSETPVSRSDDEYGDFEEVLSHDPDDVDLSRMKDGAPLLLNHNTDAQIGVIESAVIGGDRMGRAVVRFGNSALAEEVFKDVKDGVRRHVSVGYTPTKIVKDEKDPATGKRTITFGFAPYEASIVPIPADTKVGVGRSLGKRATKRNLANDECGGYCRGVENALIAMLEDLDEADVLAPILKNAIAQASIAINALQYWTDKTAADCVEVCKTAADVFKKTMDAISEQVKAGTIEEKDCEWPLDALEDCIEKLIENAGGEVVVAVAVEGQTRAVEQKLDKTTLTETGKQAEQTEKQEQQMRILLDPAVKDPTGAKSTEDIRKEEVTRMREIESTVELLVKDHPTAAEKFRAKGREAINSGMEVRDFKASMIAEIPGAKPAKQTSMVDLVNGDRAAVDRYSVSRGIQSCLLRQKMIPDGLEGEVHEEMVKRGLVAKGAGGFQVPFDAMISRRATRRQQRDLNVNTFGQGGATVQTSILTPIIELLRNRMVTDRMGVQGMAGLEGNVAIPRQTGAATAYSLPEQATLTKSTQALDQVLLTPHRVGAWNNYSRQLLLQSSIDVENFLRDDLMKVVAIKWDYLILQGQGGGSEPTGILNTTGIGSLTFGGTATWAQVVAFETALSLANADLGNMAYVTTPGVRGRWKAVAKTGVGVTSVVPIFLWEKGAWGHGSNDGEVNGYRAAATNQIANNLVFFGNWEDTIHALWGGYDVIVDPYTQATDGTNRITVNTFGDVAVRHAASYCVSQDAGNQ